MTTSKTVLFAVGSFPYNSSMAELFLSYVYASTFFLTEAAKSDYSRTEFVPTN